MSDMIRYKRPDGKECTGYYTEPAAGSAAPGVVVIQEWWGLTDQIKGVARRLTSAGYRALVPDLYRGKLTLDAAEAEHLAGNLDFIDAASQDIRGAVQHLKANGAKAAVTGFCMGGALTILSAVHVPEADAVVCWYGVPPLEAIDAGRIKAPILGHFAMDDAFFPIEQVDALEEKLRAAGVPHTFHRYNARHAFANETISKPTIPIEYNREAAETAWQRTLEFLKTQLG